MASKHKKETKQANTALAIASTFGLTTCFVAAKYYKADVPIILYGIFGGGILGTPAIIELIKTVFRVGGNGKD